MKIPPVGAQLFHADRHKLEEAVTFCRFSNAPENEFYKLYGLSIIIRRAN
jgi:hypothetical protein